MAGQIHIATAASRTSTNWQNQTVTWSWLVSRCREPKRTPESTAQYFAMTKEQQGNAKDVGGFVGGTLRGKRRKKDAVTSRDLITLDLDHAEPGFWDVFARMYRGVDAFCYSTHSHTPANPRLRLIIRLSRSIEPEAYEPVARSIAHDLGMDQFDDTTYEAERLMYFPSCPMDGEYFFAEQEGRALNPDVILSGYDDWRNAEEWPISSREVKRVTTSIRKAEDPLAKTGVVGDFCRVYSVPEAIEAFLSDIYTPGTIKNRYTYRAGTTSNGLVIYEGGRFAHAFQSTDPLCGPHSYNAFDLVRVHLFGKYDKADDLSKDVSDRPSWRKMLELVYADERFQQAMMETRLEETRGDFENVPEEEKDSKEWVKELERKKNGDIMPSAKNALLLLEHVPQFRGKLWFDEFETRIKINGGMPWDKQKEDRCMCSDDYSQINTFFAERFNFTLPRTTLIDVVITVARRHAYHPVRDYLCSLRWDGTPRLDSLFIDFLSAPDEPLVRIMTRKHLTAAVKRIFNPGCQYDNVIIFTGDQGAGKSTIIRALGGKWAKPLAPNFTGKESMEQLSGGWLFESEELRGWKGAEIEAIKSFFTRTSDHYRPAYGITTNDYPRQCVFFATTNDDIFLNDVTGNRRYWPIPVRKGKAKFSVWDDLTETYRDQIWAEAFVRYQEGEETFLTLEQEKDLYQMQIQFTDPYRDELRAAVEEFLDTPLPADWYNYSKERRRSYFRFDAGEDEMASMRRDRVCYEEIRNECLHGEKFAGRKVSTPDLSAIMKELPNWQLCRYPIRFGQAYGKLRGYTRIIDELETEL